MASILVTGSRGFLGTALCERLRTDGHYVVGWDLGHSQEKYAYSRVDINNIREMTASKFDIIIHLAAEFGRNNGERFFERMWTTATIGTRNIIEMAKRQNANLIFASSSEAYGDLGDRFSPLSEDLLETHVPNFYNEYSLSKWAGERQVRMHLPERQWLIIRPFNIYGPTEPTHQYRSFVSRLCAGEDIPIFSGVRSWLYISDFVDAMCLLLEKTGTYNIGSKCAYTNEEVARMVGREAPSFKLAEPDNVGRKVPDVSKLESLGWKQKVSLEQGISTFPNRSKIAHLCTEMT